VDPGNCSRHLCTSLGNGSCLGPFEMSGGSNWSAGRDFGDGVRKIRCKESTHSEALSNRHRLIDFKSRSLGDIGCKLGAELGHVVGE
jgi:hypothetical protein